MKKYLNYALLGLSLTVAIRLISKQDAWPWITAYWVVLTIKNKLEVDRRGHYDQS